jgi:hypothetical protein
MSALRSIKRSILKAHGKRVGMPVRLAVAPSSKKRTFKLRKLQADQAMIQKANEAAVAADPALATMSDDELAARNMAAADSKG